MTNYQITGTGHKADGTKVEIDLKCPASDDTGAIGSYGLMLDGFVARNELISGSYQLVLPKRGWFGKDRQLLGGSIPRPQPVRQY